MRIIDLENLSENENKRYNQVAIDSRHDFNNLVEKISYNHINNINWIVSSLASRNKYNSELYYRCCKLNFIKEEYRNDNTITEVRTNDKPLSIILCNYFNKNFSVVCTENYFDRFWRYLRPIRQYLIALLVFASRFFSRKSPKVLNNKNELILVETFVLNNKEGDEGNISHNGEYKDRYYPGMLDCLNDDEKKNIYFLPTIIGYYFTYSISQKIRNAKYNFILHDDYLKLSDYLFALKHPFRMLRIKFSDIYFFDFEISSLLNQENRRNCSDFISLLGLINYRFTYRLKQLDYKLNLFVDWYENQVLDRGMIVGLHNNFPDTKIVGYQGYVISKNLHLYSQPNNTELQSRAVPDVVKVTGEGLKSNILEFCNKINVDTAPGFRFKNVWRNKKYSPSENFFTILIGLPIELDDCKMILDLFLKNDKLINNPNLKIFVKPHPTSKPENIKSLFPDNNLDKFEFVIGAFHDYLEQSNLVITNASSVSLESIAKGVPVIIIAPKSGILQNPIPDDVDSKIWSICYNSNEILQKIEDYKNDIILYSSDFEKLGNYIRDKYFVPVTRELVLKFLNLS